MAKVHIEIQKARNGGQLTVRYNHNLRLNDHEDLSNIDQTRTYLNHDLVNPNNVSYRELVEERITEASNAAGHEIRRRKDAVIAYSITLSYTHGAEEENGFTVEDWEEASLAWLQGYFGRENVLSAMVHLDESSPHIHAIVTPITPDLRLCAKDFTGSPEKMSAVHRSYGLEMAKEPFHMELSNQYVKKKADIGGIKAFYRQINEIEDFEIPQKEAEETLEAYQARLTEYVKAKERKNLQKLKQMEYKLDEAYASARGLRIEFKQAINLQQYLNRVLGTRENAEMELMNLYNLEHYPRNLIEQLFSDFRKRYEIHGALVLDREYGKVFVPKEAESGKGMKIPTTE